MDGGELRGPRESFNVEVEPGELTEEERNYADEAYAFSSSEENIFSRSAEKRFEEIPEGTSLGKH